MSDKSVAILYHGGCPDGFGSAYAAWKKFGDEAEYIPVKHGQPVPEGLAGRNLYFADFSYPQETMDTLVKTAASVTVLDHHLGAKSIVESMPVYVFDEKRSGATITWSYFHPDTPVPALLQYVEDGDLYLFKLPDSRAIISYAYSHRFAFEEWDRLAQEIENTNPSLPFVQRLEKAFKYAFTDDIADSKAKQEKVKTEIKSQKLNKMAGSPHKGTPTKKSTYTDEQLAMAEKMGVELD